MNSPAAPKPKKPDTAEARKIAAEQGRADSATTLAPKVDRPAPRQPRQAWGRKYAEPQPAAERVMTTGTNKNEQSAMSKPADPVENFLKASKDYSDALHEHYRDSSDDSVLEAAKAAMKVAEKALRNSRNPKS
jgi:hypothetical protein